MKQLLGYIADSMVKSTLAVLILAVVCVGVAVLFVGAFYLVVWIFTSVPWILAFVILWVIGCIVNGVCRWIGAEG